MELRTGSSSNITDILPEILKEDISKFLDIRDALSFQSTCKGINRSIGLAVNENALFYPLQSECAWIDRDDNTNLWSRIVPMFAGKVHSIQFSCEFKDQGWGNRKGHMYIAEIENTFEGDTGGKIGNIIWSSPLAEHNWTRLRFELMPDPGKLYSIWYKVGGGGGHELFVKDFKVQSLIYDPTCAKLMNAGLPMENEFFKDMFKAVVEIMPQSHDDVNPMQQYPQLVSLFHSIGLNMTADSEQVESLKSFAEECEKVQSLPPIAPFFPQRFTQSRPNLDQRLEE